MLPEGISHAGNVRRPLSEITLGFAGSATIREADSMRERFTKMSASEDSKNLNATKANRNRGNYVRPRLPKHPRASDN